MAFRRLGLSQRRKAVGLTQESLAERLGVERSTIVRWEAGDTEPLPSIRPNVARALHVSIDQLAELLAESENAGTTRAVSADTEVTIPVRLPEVQPGRAGSEELTRPQVAEAVEALRRALRAAGVGPEDLDAMLPIGRFPADINTAGADGKPDTPVPTTVGAPGFAGSDVSEQAQTEVPHRPSLTAIPLDAEPADVQRRRARPRRFRRFAAAGALALVLAEGAASVPFSTSHSGPIPPAVAGSPVAAMPAPGPGSGNSPHGKDSTDAVDMTPAAAPTTPADGAAPVSAPHTTRATSDSRSQRLAATTPPPPRIPAIAAEAYAWSHKVALNARDQHRTRLRPGPPPRP